MQLSNRRGKTNRIDPREIKLFEQLSEENSSTQKMIVEIRTMLSQFIKSESVKHRERHF